MACKILIVSSYGGNKIESRQEKEPDEGKQMLCQSVNIWQHLNTDPNSFPASSGTEDHQSAILGVSL